MDKLELSDNQVNEINNLIKKCKNNTHGVCRDLILPCERGIDRGKCPVIIEYLKNQNS